MANRNRTVSRPSRATDTKARPARARIDPPARATSTPCSSSPFIARPWRRIQNSIQVRTTTATTAAIPSMLSWTTSGRRPTVATTSEADDDRQGDRRADPDPHASEARRDGRASRDRPDDADDERGLEAFAERDEERGGHGQGPPRLRRRARGTSQQGCMTPCYCKGACHAESTDLGSDGQAGTRSRGARGRAVRPRAAQSPPRISNRVSRQLASTKAPDEDDHEHDHADRRRQRVARDVDAEGGREPERRLADRQELGALEQAGQDALPDQDVGQTEEERPGREQR